MGTNLLTLEKLDDQSASYHAIQIAVIVCLAILAHFLVSLLRFISDWLIRKSAAKKSPVGFVTQQPKFITLTGLITSALTLIIYSVGLAFIMNVLGMPTNKFIATYLATASVVGFAVGFGSQGLVQDVITGLTLIFTDTLEVGDMVEVSGYVGRVERVGLRFTELRNFFNQQVFLSNRNISNIARFPRGGVCAYVDVRIPEKADRVKIVETVGRVAKGTWEQFKAIILTEPDVSDILPTKPDDREFVRVTFKIWPGQGSLIETTFRQRVVEALKQIDPNYADWMVVTTYRALDTSATNISI
ncbi:MAG TPA: mechanosensitive ion channel family protein [Verrucomicrobiae bacterium]